MTVRRLLALEPADRRTAALAWLLLPAVDLGLRVMPYATVSRALTRVARWLPLPCATDRRATAETGFRLVAAAARRHAWPMHCLRRTLVLRTVLEAQRVPTELRFGVRREGAELDAHCWLELDGEPVGESGESLARYVPLEDTVRDPPPEARGPG